MLCLQVLAVFALIYGLMIHSVHAFATTSAGPRSSTNSPGSVIRFMSDKDAEVDEKKKNDALLAAIDAMYGDKPLTEEPDATQNRIKSLIEDNNVVLFMKGSKFFPQCGFSDTATKILEALNVEYEAVDVLTDDSIRQGIKDFSQWPTIPQLYIKQEFIGGSDIMINMFETGELKKVLEE